MEEVPKVCDLIAEVKRPRYIKLFNGSTIIQQHEQLDFCGAKVDLRSLQVGFALDPLEFQPVEIDLRDVTRLESFSADVEHVVVVGEIVFRELQKKQ